MSVEICEENYLLIAAQNYYNPQSQSTDEFLTDLNRIKYIKRLINKYFSGEDLSTNLILNHIIIFYNVFGVETATRLLAFRCEKKYWSVIKPYLLYLKYIESTDLTGIIMDPGVVEELRKIR